MPVRSIASSWLLVFAVGAATAGGSSDRYWVAPLIGFWDDAGNWSLSEGGPAGGGIPQDGDLVRFTTRSTCLFDGQLGLPVQAITILVPGGEEFPFTFLMGVFICGRIYIYIYICMMYVYAYVD